MIGLAQLRDRAPHDEAGLVYVFKSCVSNVHARFKSRGVAAAESDDASRRAAGAVEQHAHWFMNEL
jgi:hypothetical protein